MALILTILSYQKDMKKVSETTVKSHENHQKKIPFQVRTIAPPNLHQIQPKATQVWKCDEIGFDPNSKCHKVVCTYKLFQGEIMWKGQTGEHAPFWCTLLVFTRSDGQCFMPPIVFFHAKDYSQDLHHNISLDWTVQHAPYGYMDIDGWLKYKIQFSNRCGTSSVNN